MEILKSSVRARAISPVSSARHPLWIHDKNLLEAHVRMAGVLRGHALELGCEIGAVAEALEGAGWRVERKLGPLDRLPFPDRTFNLITIRRAAALMEAGSGAWREIRRVLKPSGRLVLGHLVPFSQVDADHFRLLQERCLEHARFYTAPAIMDELRRQAFDVVKKSFVTVRESVTVWTDGEHLSADLRDSLRMLVTNAPERYRKLRNVVVRDGEILEDWNFVLLLAQPRPC